MPMLHPCPRCTQALPASAKFCRRCGAAVGGVPSQPMPASASKPGSLFTAVLSALVLSSAVITGFFYLTAHSAQTTTPAWSPAVPQPVAAPAQVYVTAPPIVVQETPNGRPVDSHFEFNQPMSREGPGHSYREPPEIPHQHAR